MILNNNLKISIISNRALGEASKLLTEIFLAAFGGAVTFFRHTHHSDISRTRRGC